MQYEPGLYEVEVESQLFTKDSRGRIQLALRCAVYGKLTTDNQIDPMPGNRTVYVDLQDKNGVLVPDRFLRDINAAFKADLTDPDLLHPGDPNYVALAGRTFAAIVTLYDKADGSKGEAWRLPMTGIVSKAVSLEELQKLTRMHGIGRPKVPAKTRRRQATPAEAAELAAAVGPEDDIHF
ncbi:MAG: hypothetical protein ACREUU_11655 [Gammaproteobacteria bacterium]